MFFLDSKVLEIINDALRGLAAHLCEIIYSVIADIYEVFVKMTELIYADDLTVIYNKISLFLGIFMIFRLSFWLIEALMNPDILGDKAKAPGEMIKKVFLVVVLLGITPSIFKYAYRLQYEVVNSNVIPKIMSIGNYNAEVEKPDKFGKLMSAELFIIFYNQNSNINVGNDSCVEDTGKNGKYYSYLKIYGKLYNLAGSPCLVKRTNDEYVIDFNGLFAVGVGAFVFWMMLMYCISLGTRYVQLIFLQVIAPIPIMGYLSTDKDNMFSKWVKQCTTTYLDVFIRLVIVHFTMWLISAVITNDSSLSKNITSGSWLIRIFIILGLLTFAKKAPELIQELLPKSVTKASGDFGLSWKKRTDAMLGGKTIYGATTAVGKAGTVGLGIGALTALRGAAGGRGVGRLTGFVGGFARGVVNGGGKGSVVKNFRGSWNRQGQVNKQKIDWANSGSTWSGRMRQRFDNALGFVGTAEGYDQRINTIQQNIDNDKRVSERTSKAISEYSAIKTEANDQFAKGGKTGFEAELQKRRLAYATVSTHLTNGDKAAAILTAQQEHDRAHNYLNITLGEVFGSKSISSFEEAQQELKEMAEKAGNDSEKLLKIRQSEEKLKDLFRDANSADELLDNVSGGKITAADAARKSNDVNDETRDELIAGVIRGDIDNKKILASVNLIKDVQRDVREIVDNPEKYGVSEEVGSALGNKDAEGLFGDLIDFSGFNKLDKAAKNVGNIVQRSIYNQEQAVADIKSSEGYKAAKADRDAVGGHSGKK